jgi:hypothetical protein
MSRFAQIPTVAFLVDSDLEPPDLEMLVPATTFWILP